MEKLDMLAGYDENVARGEATNGALAVDQAAPGADRQLIVTGFSTSTTGTAPAAGSYEATIVEDPAGAATVRRRFKIPAAAFAPVIYEFKRPLKIAENKVARITLSALGAGAVGCVELYSVTRTVTV